MIYSDICQKILGEYSEKNKYYSQLLYLLCYIGNVRKVTDIDKIVNVLKSLKKKYLLKMIMGFKKHKRMLKDLYKICLMYCIVIGEMDKARKTGAGMEKQIRENVYSCIRNKIIIFGSES